MEYRIFDTIVNVDKVVDEKERRFIEAMANFIELCMLEGEPFMSLAMIKIGDMAQIIREEHLKRMEEKTGS